MTIKLKSMTIKLRKESFLVFNLSNVNLIEWSLNQVERKLK